MKASPRASLRTGKRAPGRGGYAEAEEARVDAVDRYIAGSFSLSRPAPARVAASGVFRVGGAAVDITPALGVDTAGFGFLASRHTVGVVGRLRATAMLLEDTEGERVLFLACDLLAGSRYLAEHLGARLGPSLGLSVDRIWLGASHTHAGPGHIFGDSFYDCLAARENDFDLQTSTFILDRLERAALDAASRLRPGRFGLGEAPAWGALWHRSFGAFLANFGEPTEVKDVGDRAVAFAAGAFGVAPPAEGSPDRIAVDPRVQALWAEADGGPVAVLVIVHGTPSILPASAAVLSPDATGWASRHVHRSLHATFGADVPVGFAGGLIGDVNVVDPTLSVNELRARRVVPEPGQIPDQVAGLADRASRALGVAALVACERARAAARADLKIIARFREVLVPRASVDGRRLPAEHQVGNAQFGGSELNRPEPGRVREPFRLTQGVLARMLVGEGSDPSRRLGGPVKGRPDPDDPHAPKRYGLYRILRHTRRLFKRNRKAGRDLDPHLVLRVLRLGPWTFAGVGVEPSVALGARIREALGTAPEDTALMGLVGGYAGYAITEGEYDVQDYEGAATFWGRDFGALIVDQIRDLAVSRAEAAPGGEAYFNSDLRSEPPVSLATPPQAEGGNADLWIRIYRRSTLDIGSPLPEPAGRGPLEVAAARLAAQGPGVVWGGSWWSLPTGEAAGPWGDTWTVRLERWTGTGWEPVRWGACDCDDAQVDLAVRRRLAPDEVHLIWEVEGRFPEELLPEDARVRWAVHGRPEVAPVAGARPAVARWSDGEPEG